MPASTCRRRGRPSPGCNAACPSAWPGALRQAATAGQGQGARGILAEPLAQLQAQVEYLSDQLIAGARGPLWPSPGCCSRSASRWPRRRAGGAAGAAGQRRRGLPEPAGDGFARRWREAAFLPIVTPSLVQLKTELAKRRARLAAEAAA